MSNETFPDTHYSYDYYWDRNRHLPRFYMVEPAILNETDESPKDHEIHRKSSLVEQDLEQFVTPVAEEILTADSVPLTDKGLLFGNAVQMSEEGDTLKITFDVDHCRADELSVRTVGHALIVEGSEEATREKKHNRFLRKFDLPQVFDPKSVLASLSKDGKLTIEMSVSRSTEHVDHEREIEIQREQDS